MTAGQVDRGDRHEQILEAVLRVLARDGISALSIRAVARDAGVAAGLVGYYYEDKATLIRAALHRMGEQDLALLDPDPALSPEDQAREVIRRVARPEFLTTEYLSLRLHLWSLAQAHEDFEAINTRAQAAYRAKLAALIKAARPALGRAECARRAADVDVVQNGLWLTALLGLDAASVKRSVARCEEIALG